MQNFRAQCFPYPPCIDVGSFCNQLDHSIVVICTDSNKQCCSPILQMR